MKSILFVKYNSTRKPEYRIKTEIVADETDKYVIKTEDIPESYIKYLDKYNLINTVSI